MGDAVAGQSASGAAEPVLAPWLLQILRCPVDRGELTEQGQELACQSCGRVYPVTGGIPVLIADEPETV